MPERPRIFGVLNVTTDSFSDGGRFLAAGDAIAQGIRLAESGADYIDVGGESTRPGADRVPAEVEQARVLPVVAALAERGIAVSIDTMNADTARAAVEAGAAVVNDVSGGLADAGMAAVVAEAGVPFVAMHWRGPSSVMTTLARYDDVVAEVRTELAERRSRLIDQGVAPEQIVLDPGLGFAKDAEHNWRLLAHLDELHDLGSPLLVGASRKRFLAALPGIAEAQGSGADPRDLPTAVVSALAALAGVWALRVHDVAGTRTALDVVDAWRRGA
ncbi:MAG: folP [Naasia sp.]|uniref:dihydropteroate synthase n=1 Tax=Naasia sp. TaxID=2546198 RepID=UPI0026076F06|nr:dihydropteroate synthase [Naasia sp.]MCU1571192.1 folP [Naasia sp.]